MESYARGRAEAYLCLARAFLVPREPGALAALGEALPTDLIELLGDTPEQAGRIERVQRAATRIPDDNALLRGYSALFLTPPYPVPLNAGLHLDRAIMGSSAQQIRALYQRYGLDRAADFRDLPDHLAVELEFVARLWAMLAGIAPTEHSPEQVRRDLAGFLERYVARWLPSLSRSLDTALADHSVAALYMALAEILHVLVDTDRAWLASAHPADTAPTKVRDSEAAPEEAAEPADAVSCTSCGRPLMVQEELRAALMDRLREAGVSTAHLRLCPDCRGAAMGLEPLDPVTVRRR
ncbi:MAG: molecular chaperone TorD family protein [Halofilum sp. (in: g-proteobacteria)]|nr:molecular chaperone TorD family protein [Halofilum sp. (in: g-proteobacteria)]